MLIHDRMVIQLDDPAALLALMERPLAERFHRPPARLQFDQVGLEVLLRVRIVPRPIRWQPRSPASMIW
jgi:hypothetical protein